MKKIAQMTGYQLVMHAKARRNEDGTGRPSGGLPIWIHNSNLDVYHIGRVKHAQYIQKLKMTSIYNPDKLPSIMLTNAYCKPTKRRKDLAKFFNKIGKNEDNSEAIQMTICDLNAKTSKLADNKSKPMSPLLLEHLQQKNWTNLNQECAFGTPIYDTTTGEKSIVDLALMPSNQLNLWTNLEDANTHNMTLDAHHSIIAESMMPIYHQATQTETRYTINYNESDAHGLQAHAERITSIVQDKIIDIQDRYLQKQTSNTSIHKGLEVFQDTQTGIHHIAVLTMFGMKRQAKPQHDMYSRSNAVEIQEILNNYDQDEEQKTQQLCYHNINNEEKRRKENNN